MAEKPKANPLAYKARNMQPTHDKDVPDESVENETASQEKKVIATSHHPVRAGTPKLRLSNLFTMIL